MQNKTKNLLTRYLFPLAFWLSLWQVLSLIVDKKFLLPGIPDTIKALLKLLCESDFYLAATLSALRVLIGLALGIILGFLLAILCNHSKIASSLILPIVTLIKSTPVASFIVVLWVMMSGDALSVFIGFLMVMPIILQNTLDGYNAIDIQLSEVADVFEINGIHRFKILVYPTLKRYLLPAIISSAGLAWKAEIAAEIIAYTKRSIGQGINDAKYNMDTPTVFAWTVVIITFSIILEKCTKKLLGRWSK